MWAKCELRTQTWIVRAAVTVLAATLVPNAYAGFGTVQVADNLQIVRIFSGRGTTYVTFSGTAMPGCNGNNSGYLTPSWPEANGGPVDEHRTAQMVATLLFAKATGATMAVHYRVNDQGNGWNYCAIDAVWLH